MVGVADDSVAARVGLHVGDELVAIDGRVPADVIEYQRMVDEAHLALEVRRNGLAFDLEVEKRPGEPLGAMIDASIFDEVQTCDNHCEFCFIYQLPKGLRQSLYLKDDDYRLSFLYGNYTTLTRFTEADLERVVTERLSPLNVSIHATDPEVRSTMLRNRRGALSLRWLEALLDNDIEVHGQIVVCPGVNDGDVLDATLADIADRYNRLATVCVVPLGVSRFTSEPRLRAHTVGEATRVLDTVDHYQSLFEELFGCRIVFAADEYYLLSGRPFPPLEHYGDVAMHEDGVGMAATFAAEFAAPGAAKAAPRPGFFASVEGAPAEGYRSVRSTACGPEATRVSIVDRGTSTVVLTSTLGASVIAPLVAELGRGDVRIASVQNRFFGGNTAVAGLMVGEDIDRVLRTVDDRDRVLLPDVCLSGDRFLDGRTVGELCRSVDVVASDGASLRRALGR